MNVPSLKHHPQQWTHPRDNSMFISTDPSLIPVTRLNALLASEAIYWARDLPEDQLVETLRNSLSFGIYHRSNTTDGNTLSPSSISSSDVDVNDDSENNNDVQFIGYARCVTDYTTFLYLTDVHVCPSHQGQGLGKWLIECVQSVVRAMPYLRRSMLFTSDWERSVPFYERLMGMEVLRVSEREDEVKVGPAVMEYRGPGHPFYSV